MTATLALSLFNMARFGTFSVRNADKTAHGDLVRGAVTAGQARNAAAAISEMGGKAGKKAKEVVDTLDAAAKCDGFLGRTAQIVNLSSKLVNPLLCVSGAIKVAKSDDKKSEAIKQASALSTMFAFEATGRRLFMEPVRNKFMATKLGQTAGITNLLKCMDKLDKYSKTAGKTSNFAKFGIPIIKGLAYVGMSITGYELGTKGGNAINNYLKSKSSDTTEPPAPGMAIAALSGVKPVTEEELNDVKSKFNRIA